MKDIIHTEVNGKKFWYSMEEAIAHDRFMEERFNYMVNHYKPIDHEVRELRNKEKKDLKWCDIKVGNTTITAMIDKKTNRVYKCNGYKVTDIEWKKYTFIKYLNSMEL